ncbi:hypothetical protein BDZ94DRAFT_1161833 [Collybia nuda]|uniref:DNA repair protein REV1 n=1 Tax=Collybia nuda TaxID=64659 RepID=A0A9P6CG11_9AGAR|nr:hypothetical protein BDZ94DRAFT_1161833 [Collybia nuda]
MPQVYSQTNSSDYYDDDDADYIEALQTATLPGDDPEVPHTITGNDQKSSQESEFLEPPPPTQPSLKRRRLEAYEERHSLIYGAAHFGDFGEYMHRKRAKLQIQNDELEEPGSASKILTGLAIYINGYTQPSIQDLRNLIVKHGGIFHAYLDRKSIVTHVITCSLTPAKIREFKNLKVVRPEWLVQSAEEGVLLPWSDFIFVGENRLEDFQGMKARQQNLHDMQPKKAAPLATNTKPAQIDNLELPVREEPMPEDDAVPKYAAHKSNPLAARVMANPEWRKAHTSVAPDFIEGYYKNSRLHHLSTWKSELKNLVQEAQERAEAVGGAELVGKVDSEVAAGVSMRGAELVMKSPRKGKGKGKEKAVDDRVIMHCDFDCFFVSAGLVTRPQLKGKPVVVCHSQGAQGGASSTSEVASASYEARKFGIKNGMSLQQCRKLCPGIVTIPYEFERYKQLSLKFYTILMSHADDLQAVSVDEALIDVSNTVTQLRSRGSQDPDSVDPAKDFAERIRAQVRQATGCEVSIGISHNILLARLATRRAKPAGSYHLIPSEVTEFLAPLDIADLHGFGSSTKHKALDKLGATALGNLMEKSKGALSDALGKSTGETLYNALRGIDDRKLESDKPRKSVSCEINYGIRFENNEQAQTFVFQMASEVSKRLDEIGMVGRSITLKIMKRDPTAPVEPPKFLGHGSCDLFNKQISLIGAGGKATSDESVVGEHAWRLLRSFNFDPKELRGLGIQIQKLESPSAAANAQVGQAVLPFQRVSSPQKPPIRQYGPPPVPPVIVQPPSQEEPKVEDVGVTDSRDADPIKPSVSLDLPSFSQVDLGVFNALPFDVRKELQDEYKRRSTSPGFAKPGPPPRAPSPEVYPKQMVVKGVVHKAMPRPMPPRNRFNLSPLKRWLLKRKRGKAGAVHMTNAQLHQLGFDPEVFNSLPPALQHEQLTMKRLIRDRGSLPDPPSQRKVLKPRKRKPIPPHLLWRAPAPKARYVTPVILRQQGKEKREKLVFSEKGDIQDLLEKWIGVYRNWAPAEQDVELFAKYLVKSIDGRTYGDTSVERAVAVLKWWLVLLRRYWGGSELIKEEGMEDPTNKDPVGEAWWKAFRGVKKRMDVVARARFGGCLSLR